MLQKVCTNHRFVKKTYTDSSGGHNVSIVCGNCGIDKNTIKTIKLVRPLKFKRKKGRPSTKSSKIAKDIDKDYRKSFTRKRNKLVGIAGEYSGETFKSINLAIRLFDMVLDEELILNEEIIKNL